MDCFIMSLFVLTNVWFGFRNFIENHEMNMHVFPYIIFILKKVVRHAFSELALFKRQIMNKEESLCIEMVGRGGHNIAPIYSSL